ncbi:MAG TPA: alpha/beta fold hydrolase [Sphingomicrobium sp.]|nr:alpha/beta fold hydrolase [Sphingomicrobium sp.]
MIVTALAAVAATFQPAPCSLEGVPASFEKEQEVECGWVAVPLNKSGGKTIRLWTARIRATSEAPEADPILYINGGPGIATVDSILPALPTSKKMKFLREDRDVILFDQRGSGRSEEALCPKLAKTLNGISSQGLDPIAEDDRARQAFAACRAHVLQTGSSVENYTTAATVADMEALRRAFRVDEWNLVSISYGSLVALHAMRVSPESIRSVILDSPYPPNSVTWAEQASSTASAYQAIGRACAAQPECHDPFGEIVPKLEATLERLEREPVEDGKTIITGRKFASALWPLAVRSDTNGLVPVAIHRAHAGDTEMIKKLVAMFGGGDSFGGFSPAQALAISCYETGRTREWYTRARSLYPALVSAAPDDSWDKLCATYRPGYADPAFFAPVSSSVPTLIYAGTLDPATPLIDAYQAMRFLTNATLVQVEGAAHGPMSIDDCARSIAAGFLEQPATAPDVSCMAKREPARFARDGLDKLLTKDAG